MLDGVKRKPRSMGLKRSVNPADWGSVMHSSFVSETNHIFHSVTKEGAKLEL